MDTRHTSPWWDNTWRGRTMPNACLPFKRSWSGCIFRLPPVVAPHAGWDVGGAGAGDAPVEAVGAGRGAAPSTAEPPAEEEHVDMGISSLESIVGWVNLLWPPVPRLGCRGVGQPICLGYTYSSSMWGYTQKTWKPAMAIVVGVVTRQARPGKNWVQYLADEVKAFRATEGSTKI